MKRLWLLGVMIGVLAGGVAQADFKYKLRVAGHKISVHATPQQYEVRIDKRVYKDLERLTTIDGITYQYQGAGKQLLVSRGVSRGEIDDVTVTVGDMSAITREGGVIRWIEGKKVRVIKVTMEGDTSYLWNYQLVTKHRVFEIARETTTKQVPDIFRDALKTFKLLQ